MEEFKRETKKLENEYIEYINKENSRRKETEIELEKEIEIDIEINLIDSKELSGDLKDETSKSIIESLIPILKGV
jgi:hypothetical protein